MSGSTHSTSSWPSQLEAAARVTAGRFRRVIVLAETGSTQDAARRMGAAAGDIVVAARQTAGRGRFGRVWADTADDGVAITFVVSRDEPERLAVLAAVVVADALAPLLPRHPVGIKWPNDIFADGRKLAGVLIEQHDDTALIGIGVNVGQSSWPTALAARAVSIAQLGGMGDRLEVMRRLIDSFARHLDLDDASRRAAFVARDVLTGSIASFRSAGRAVHGTVVRVDPGRGLAVQTHAGEQWLPAAVTTVVSIDSPRTGTAGQ
jgi:BirA family transcriptional regulator, biotin operon repressor / biotin---[acetyl-CoA-carboxylase] ligase